MVLEPVQKIPSTFEIVGVSAKGLYYVPISSLVSTLLDPGRNDCIGDSLKPISGLDHERPISWAAISAVDRALFQHRPAELEAIRLLLDAV